MTRFKSLTSCTLAACVLVLGTAGCDEARVEQRSDSERTRTGSVPPQGMESNPAQPRTVRPTDP